MALDIAKMEREWQEHLRLYGIGNGKRFFVGGMASTESGPTPWSVIDRTKGLVGFYSPREEAERVVDELNAANSPVTKH